MNEATVYYYLANEPEEEVKLEFLDLDGTVVNMFSSKEGANVSAKTGMNRFVWDLRYPAAEVVPDSSSSNAEVIANSHA